MPQIGGFVNKAEIERNDNLLIIITIDQISALTFRQDYRINKIFFPFQKRGKSIIPPGGKAFAHCAKET
jgi:hypothetical protein